MDLSMEQPQTTDMATAQMTTPNTYNALEPPAAKLSQPDTHDEEENADLAGTMDLHVEAQQRTKTDDEELCDSTGLKERERTEVACLGMESVTAENNSDSESENVDNCEHDQDSHSEGKCNENEDNSVDGSSNGTDVDSKTDFKGDANKLLSRKKEILASFSVDSGLDMNKNCESSEEDAGGLVQETALDTAEDDTLNATIRQNAALDTGQATGSDFSNEEKDCEVEEACVAETVDLSLLPNSSAPPTIVLSTLDSHSVGVVQPPTATEQSCKTEKAQEKTEEATAGKRQSVKDKIKARRRQTSNPNPHALPPVPSPTHHSHATPSIQALRSASFESTASSGCEAPEPAGSVPKIQVSDPEQTEGKEEAPLATQLAQLQGMVGEMKAGFVVAMEALSRIQHGDEMLTQKVDDNQAQHQQQLADVINMVLTLKGEFGVVVDQLHSATDSQRGLEIQVQRLQYERDILLEELEKAGTISPTLRQQYHSGQLRPHTLNRSSSNTTLAVLLERARNTFAATPTTVHCSPSAPSHSHSHSHSQSLLHQHSPHPSPASSQADSGVTGFGGHTPSPSHLASAPTNIHHSPHTDNSPYATSGVGYPADDVTKADPDSGAMGSVGSGGSGGSGGYESDSSVTAAANKSLDLSRSLGNCCADDPVSANQSEEDDDAAFKKPTPPPPQDPYDHSSPYKGKKGNAVPRTLPPHERNAADTQRSRVAREIVETERKYCNTLWTVLDHFALPVRDCGYLPARDVCLMFPASLSRIYELHCDFLQQLEDRLLNWKYHGVLGDLFAKFTDSPECQLLAHYQQYVNEFPSSLQLIKKLNKSNVKLRRLLKVLQRHPVCESLDLSSFLLAPIQRVPRYVLLLKQLLKYTGSDHPDAYHLDASIHKLATFLTRLNDSIEHSMHLVAAGGGGDSFSANMSVSGVADTSATDHSPKPRRKLRIPSFRQQSSNPDSSSISLDAGSQDTPALRRGSTGPFSSFLKDKRSSIPPGQLPHTPRKLPCPPTFSLDTTPQPPQKPKPKASEQGDRVLVETEVTPTSTCNTLPLRARKRRSQLNKRPKSGGDCMDTGNDGYDKSAHNESIASEKYAPDMDSNNGSVLSSSSMMIRRPRSVVTGIAEESEEGEREGESPGKAARSRSAPLHRPLHRSMPKIPNTPIPAHYGILGKDDEDEENGDGANVSGGEQGSRTRGYDVDDDGYYGQQRRNRNRNASSGSRRSRDTLDAVDSGMPPPPSPTQRRLIASVARSLSQREPPKPQRDLNPNISKLPSGSDPDHGRRVRDLHSLTLPSHPPAVMRAWPGDTDTSPGPDDTLNETIDMLNLTEPTGAKPTKRRGWRKKKHLTESMIEPDTSTNRWKVANIKSSIKNIFSRKRKTSTSTSSQDSTPCTTPQDIRGSRVFGEVSPAASLHSLPTIHSNSHLNKEIKAGKACAEKTSLSSLNPDPVSAV